MIYDIIFDGQKITVEADYVNCIGTKAWFRTNDEKLVAYFDIPFGTSFAYAIRPTKPEDKTSGGQAVLPLPTS